MCIYFNEKVFLYGVNVYVLIPMVPFLWLKIIKKIIIWC